MKSSSLFRIIFLVIVVVFVLNFVVLLVYFPIVSSSTTTAAAAAVSSLSSLSSEIKKHEPYGKPKDKILRKKHRQKQQRPPLQVRDERHQQEEKEEPGQKQRIAAATTTSYPKSNAKTKENCRVYGCPVYPPELTTPHTNQTIVKTLESSGYSFLPFSSRAEQPLSKSEFRFGFASDSFATLSQQGKSHTINQDRAVFVSPYLSDLLSSTSTSSTKTTTKSFLACIFDGHGELGHKVAQEVVEKFPLLLSEKLALALGVGAGAYNTMRTNKSNNSNSNTNETILVRKEDYDSTDLAIRKALNETFLEVNGKGTAFTFLRGGCTASVTLRWGSKLYVANAGDSETIVVSASPSSEPQKLRKQHNSRIAHVEYGTRRDKANQPKERARIEKLGGKIHVNAQGFDPRVIYFSNITNDTVGLAMSRSIGDWETKAVGVTAEPTIDVIDLSKPTLSDPDKTVFLLAASDGFWDMRQKQFYATQMTASFPDGNKNHQDRRDEDDANAHIRPLYHLYDIIRRITPKVQKGYRDDITAMIVNLE